MIKPTHEEDEMLEKIAKDAIGQIHLVLQPLPEKYRAVIWYKVIHKAVTNLAKLIEPKN
jgi:hypothetical protein